MLTMWNDVFLTSERSREFSITNQLIFLLFKTRKDSQEKL